VCSPASSVRRHGVGRASGLQLAYIMMNCRRRAPTVAEKAKEAAQCCAYAIGVHTTNVRLAPTLQLRQADTGDRQSRRAMISKRADGWPRRRAYRAHHAKSAERRAHCPGQVCGWSAQAAPSKNPYFIVASGVSGLPLE